MFNPHTVCHCEMKAFLQGHQWMAGPKTDHSRACGAVGTRDLGTVRCGGGNWAKLPRAADLLEALGWAVVCRDKGQLESQHR